MSLIRNMGGIAAPPPAQPGGFNMNICFNPSTALSLDPTDALITTFATNIPDYNTSPETVSNANGDTCKLGSWNRIWSSVSVPHANDVPPTNPRTEHGMAWQAGGDVLNQFGFRFDLPAPGNYRLRFMWSSLNVTYIYAQANIWDGVGNTELWSWVSPNRLVNYLDEYQVRTSDVAQSEAQALADYDASYIDVGPFTGPDPYLYLRRTTDDGTLFTCIGIEQL